MSLWDNIMWLANRPQQSVFQGADLGRQSFESDRANILPRDAAQLSDPSSLLDWQNLGSGVMSGLKSLPAMAAGNALGWTGLGNDVRGEQLTDNPFSGAVLDFAADPLSLFPAAQSQKLGTMARTGSNLLDLWNTGKPSFNMFRDYGLGKSLLNLDIASAPRAAEDILPTVIRHEGNLTGLLENLLKAKPLPQGSNVRGFVGRGPRAMLPPDSTILAYDTSQAVPSLIHEFGHWASLNSPNRGELANIFNYLAGKYPSYLESLQAGYGHQPPWKQMEEFLVRKINPGGEAAQKIVSRLPQTVKDWAATAENSVPPVARVAANPLDIGWKTPNVDPMEALSFLGNDIASSYNETNQNFKDWMALKLGMPQSWRG